eukprot:2782265-Pleurochrysis_carterae.AAC.1
MHDLGTRATRLQSLSSLQATRADALDSLLSYTLRLRWLAAAYMFVFAVVPTLRVRAKIRASYSPIRPAAAAAAAGDTPRARWPVREPRLLRAFRYGNLSVVDQ